MDVAQASAEYARLSDPGIRDAISARNALFEDAYNAGDAARLVESYFVRDALNPVACPPGGHVPVRGRAALVAMFASMLADVSRIRLETAEVFGSGDVACEWGRGFLTAVDGRQLIGRYSVCWVLSGDEWRAKTDFFAEDGWSE